MKNRSKLSEALVYLSRTERGPCLEKPLSLLLDCATQAGVAVPEHVAPCSREHIDIRSPLIVVKRTPFSPGKTDAVRGVGIPKLHFAISFL